MPPKKKTSAAAAPSTSLPPPLEQTSGGVDAGGRKDADEEAHNAARSKNKAAQTSATVDVPRHSQEAQDQQRHGTSSAIRMIAQDQASGSRGAQDQHACQRAGTSGARSPGRDTAPSNIVRSPSTSRSSRRPPLPPTNVGQDRRMEGHHSESHRLRQRRHSAVAEHFAAAAGLPGASRWRRSWWGRNHHAITAPKAKIADSPDPPRQRLHCIVGSTSSSRSTPSSSRTTARRRSYSHRAPKGSATSIRQARWALY